MSKIDQWDLARYAFGVALLLCNIGVWRGVALEESRLLGLKEAGKKLLIRSLALEAIFAALLFAVDTVGALHQKREIGELYDRAAKAELATETLKSQFGWRVVSLDEGTILKLTLGKQPPGKINISYIGGDAESGSYANQFAIIFNDEHWQVGMMAFSAIIPTTYGLQVPLLTGEASQASSKVRAALTLAHIEFGDAVIQPSSGQATTVWMQNMTTAGTLFVGPKRMPWSRDAQ